MLMTQEAPYPAELERLVASVKYKPGWVFRLGNEKRREGGTGLTLTVLVAGQDIYSEDSLTIRRDFAVPAVTYSERAWRRWIFEQVIMAVELHEAAEAFLVGGERVFEPLHGEGDNPYVLTETVSPEDHRSDYLCNYVAREKASA